LLSFYRQRPPARTTLFPYTTLFRSDVQPRAVPEAGRRIAGIRVRLRGARPDVAHLGADEVGGGSGDLGEAPPPVHRPSPANFVRSEEHTSELQSRVDLVCRLLLEKT